MLVSFKLTMQSELAVQSKQNFKKTKENLPKGVTCIK